MNWGKAAVTSDGQLYYVVYDTGLAVVSTVETNPGKEGAQDPKYAETLVYAEGLTEIPEVTEMKARRYLTTASSVVIPSSAHTINSRATIGDRTTELFIPPTVKTISYQAFFRNETLQSVVISGGVQTVGEEAFMGCTNLKKVVLCEGVQTIDWDAFDECFNLTDITIPSSVTSIRYRAFSESGLTSITIPNASIGEIAFKG